MYAIHNTTDIEKKSYSIEIQNLKVFSASKTILTVDRLLLPNKGVVALMGPSGCGKSSLLKALADLEDECVAHTGSIALNFANGTNLRPAQQFAMVWQQPTVFPCAIWDNLKIPLRKRGIAKDTWRQLMEAALAETGLLEELGPNWSSLNAQCISGGQQQRLCIAMGILKDANAILLDEPTSALDPISTEKIEHIIQRLATKKLIMLVTHSIGQARRLSEYTAMFCCEDNVGYLCEFGFTEQLFHQPQSTQSRKFILRETGL